jgi:large exoprotein involved in heme utilization and adhesion
VNFGAVGNGGNVSINARSASLTNRATLQTDTSGQGNAGNISINATDLAAFDNSSAFSSVELTGVGSGGEINIDARNVSLTNASVLSASISGLGNAGDISITAKDLVSLDNSGAFSAVLSTGIGSGGNIEVNAQRLDILNGGQITSSTSSSGNAGTIKILLGQSLVLDGSLSLINAGTEVGSSGNSGSIFIDPPLINITNGAGISVSSLGTGLGGDITIFANNLNLSNSAFIKAETSVSNGGNITLNIPSILLLRYGSQISTTAGTALAGGNGGNIDITAGFIVGLRGENSDIANSNLKCNT